MLATYSGRLEPALDLQARDAELDQSWDQVERREVLRAEQVLDVGEVEDLAVADDLVGEPAGLGAFAPVGRPAAERLAGQALAGVGDAEGAVDEDLDGKVGVVADPGDLAEGQLAGQDHPRAAELLREPDALGAGDRHLGRGVDLQVGRDRPDQPGQANVLDDHGVDSGLGDELGSWIRVRPARWGRPEC